MSEYSKEYYEKNKEKIKETQRKWREKNKEKKSQYDKKYLEENKEKKSEYYKKYYEENKEKRKEYEKSEKRKEYRKEYRQKNKEKMKKWHDDFVKKNQDKIKEYRKTYYKNNKEKINHIISWRSILRNTLIRMGTEKEGHTVDILGYSAEDLKSHMENLFTNGMSWDNYGEWHVDHIKPVSSFDKNEKISVVCALENLQPLWATTRTINGIVYEGNLNKGTSDVM